MPGDDGSQSFPLRTDRRVTDRRGEIFGDAELDQELELAPRTPGVAHSYEPPHWGGCTPSYDDCDIGGPSAAYLTEQRSHVGSDGHLGGSYTVDEDMIGPSVTQEAWAAQLPARVKQTIQTIEEVGYRHIIWRKGYSLLHHAAAQGERRLLEWLISQGGDVLARDCNGQTPSSYATRHGHYGMQEILNQRKHARLSIKGNLTIDLWSTLPHPHGMNAVGELEYLHLPRDIREVFRKWDTDNSGTVSIEELEAACRRRIQFRNVRRRMYVVVLLILFGGFFLWLMTLGAIYFMVGATGRSGRMRNPFGEVVRVQADEYKVVNGELQMRDSPKPIATRTQLHEGVISAAMPDSMLEELKEIRLSDGVLTVVGEIDSAGRRKMSNSKCGHVVYLNTHIGQVLVDDRDLFLSKEAENYLVGMGFDPTHLQAGVVTRMGRRLEGGAEMMMGLFSFVEQYDWKCESIPKAEIPELPFQYRSLQSHWCLELTDSSEGVGCKSELLPGTHKPGVRSGRTWETRHHVLETKEFRVELEWQSSHPLQRKVRFVRKGGNTTKFQIFDERSREGELQVGSTFLFCEQSQEPSESSVFDAPDTLQMNALGTTVAEEVEGPAGMDTSVLVHRFEIAPKENEEADDAPIPFPPLEMWQRYDDARPHKVFVVGEDGNALSPNSLFSNTTLYDFHRVEEKRVEEIARSMLGGISPEAAEMECRTRLDTEDPSTVGLAKSWRDTETEGDVSRATEWIPRMTGTLGESISTAEFYTRHMRENGVLGPSEASFTKGDATYWEKLLSNLPRQTQGGSRRLQKESLADYLFDPMSSERAAANFFESVDLDHDNEISRPELQRALASGLLTSNLVPPSRKGNLRAREGTEASNSTFAMTRKLLDVPTVPEFAKGTVETFNQVSEALAPYMGLISCASSLILAAAMGPFNGYYGTCCYIKIPPLLTGMGIEICGVFNHTESSYALILRKHNGPVELSPLGMVGNLTVRYYRKNAPGFKYFKFVPKRLRGNGVLEPAMIHLYDGDEELCNEYERSTGQCTLYVNAVPPYTELQFKEGRIVTHFSFEKSKGSEFDIVQWELQASGKKLSPYIVVHTMDKDYEYEHGDKLVGPFKVAEPVRSYVMKRPQLAVQVEGSMELFFSLGSFFGTAVYGTIPRIPYFKKGTFKMTGACAYHVGLDLRGKASINFLHSLHTYEHKDAVGGIASRIPVRFSIEAFAGARFETVRSSFESEQDYPECWLKKFSLGAWAEGGVDLLFEDIAPGLTPTFNLEWFATANLKVLGYFELKKTFGPIKMFETPFKIGRITVPPEPSKDETEALIKCSAPRNSDGSDVPVDPKVLEQCGKDVTLTSLNMTPVDNTALYNSEIQKRENPCHVTDPNKSIAIGDVVDGICPGRSEPCVYDNSRCCCPLGHYWRDRKRKAKKCKPCKSDASWQEAMAKLAWEQTCTRLVGNLEDVPQIKCKYWEEDKNKKVQAGEACWGPCATSVLVDGDKYCNSVAQFAEEGLKMHACMRMSSSKVDLPKSLACTYPRKKWLCLVVESKEVRMDSEADTNAASLEL